MQAAALDLLEKANFTPQQARFVAQAIETEVGVHHDHLATKEDVLAVKADLELKMSGLELKIEQVRREIADIKGDLIKWVVGIVGTQAIVVSGGVWFLVQHSRP